LGVLAPQTCGAVHGPPQLTTPPQPSDATPQSKPAQGFGRGTQALHIPSAEQVEGAGQGPQLTCVPQPLSTVPQFRLPHALGLGTQTHCPFTQLFGAVQVQLSISPHASGIAPHALPQAAWALTSSVRLSVFA